MGLPSNNLHGYEQGQLLNKVDNIKTKMYYLIHGTLDDNVHYQQSLLLAKVLEQKDILFRQQVRSSVKDLRPNNWFIISTLVDSYFLSFNQQGKQKFVPTSITILLWIFFYILLRAFFMIFFFFYK